MHPLYLETSGFESNLSFTSLADVQTDMVHSEESDVQPESVPLVRKVIDRTRTGFKVSTRWGYDHTITK